MKNIIKGRFFVEFLNFYELEGKESKHFLELFDYFFVKNGKLLVKHLPQIHFVPDFPELSEIKSIVEKNQIKLSDELIFLVKGLTQQHPQVRLMAINKMISLVKEKRGDLYKMVSGDEMIEGSFRDVFENMLKGKKKKN